MFNRIRTKLHAIVQSPLGDGLAAVRIPKMVARRADELLGTLLGTPDAGARSDATHAPRSVDGSATTATTQREPAPVIVYFEKDRNQRLIERVQELLKAKGIAYRALDVSGDAATIAFITREAKCEDDDLPIVFVAGTAIGGYNDVVDWDLSGKLRLAVFGPTP